MRQWQGTQTPSGFRMEKKKMTQVVTVTLVQGSATDDNQQYMARTAA